MTNDQDKISFALGFAVGIIYELRDCAKFNTQEQKERLQQQASVLQRLVNEIYYGEK